jgi:hypothetical protein
VHHVHGLGIVIHQHKLTAEFQTDGTGGATAGEEIQQFFSIIKQHKVKIECKK